MINKANCKNNIQDSFDLDRELNEYLWLDLITLDKEVIDSFFYLTKLRNFESIIEKYGNITISEFLDLF